MALNFSKVNFGYNIPKRTLKHKIKRTYPKVEYNLKDINLHIDSKDEFITILGHTGSGKSTLVQLMNALNIPTNGSLNIFGVDINKKTKLKPIRQKVGLVFQFPEYQIFEETVIKDIEFGPKNFGLDASEAKKVSLEAANLVGLSSELLEKSPFNLSGGQMRKVAISGIVASNPEILVLDEPTAGLDPQGKSELLDLLKMFNEKLHKTIILITHDMEVVAKCSKRTIVLNHGSIVYDGATIDLFKSSDLHKKFNLDYPEIVKIMFRLKEKLNLEDLDPFKFTVEEAYSELKRVLGEADEH